MGPQFLAFEQLLKENAVISNLALYCSRHYIFTRELNRARKDIERIEGEHEVFQSAQQYVDQQKDELTLDQRAHLEVEILNKTKSFDTKLCEAKRRATYFKQARMENIEKAKAIVNSG